jgi:protein-S-isoprenylcysteine O-methyltransferase Ste14
VLAAVYWAAVVGQMIIRYPHARKRRPLVTVDRRLGRREAAALWALGFGNGVFPLVYTLTSWLDFADYRLPAWASWLGIGLMLAALVLFALSHSGLSTSWSPTLEIYESHELIQSGIYGRIRHPMYASQFVFVLAQALLLQNWIAGAGGVLLFAVFYFIRVPAEERIMSERFGGEYEAYRRRTGGIFPKLM